MSSPSPETERELREQIADQGRSLFERRFTHGSTGNLSVRVPDGILVTPTGSSLGKLDPDRISKVDFNGDHIAGDRPSKEAFLHLSMYASRPNETAIVHLHSTYSVAVSVLQDTNPDNVLPAITAYYQMRVGKCPLVKYFAPGDRELAEEVKRVSRTARSMLLANHGPVVSAKSLSAAVDAAEELEETAKLYLLLKNQAIRTLDEQQCQELAERFGN